jgi:hypothetical protein
LGLEYISTYFMFDLEINEYYQKRIRTLYDNYQKILETFFGKSSETEMSNHSRILYLHKICDHYLQISFSDTSLDLELGSVITKIFNELCHIYLDNATPQLQKLLRTIRKVHDKFLLFCPVSPWIMMILTKYISQVSGMFNCFEMPMPASSFRIEEWTDGITRIYYNDWCLACF